MITRNISKQLLMFMLLPLLGIAHNSDKTWIDGTADVNIPPTELMRKDGPVSGDHPADELRYDIGTKTVALEEPSARCGEMECIDPIRISGVPSDSISFSVKGWEAGVARAIITPKGELWMAGYASRDKPTADKRHDLWVKAMAIKDENGSVGVLVSMDVVGIPKYLLHKVYDGVYSKYGITKEQLLVNGSHTHTGPVLYDPFRPKYSNTLEGELLGNVIQYSERLVNEVIKTIGAAINSMEPARIYSGQGMARFQVNRRNNIESKILSSTEFIGPNDYAVPVIKVESRTGKTKVVLFGYACHATVLNDYKWSGDYPGFAQIELEKMYPGATAMFFQGCGGDQNPLPRGTPHLAKQYGHTLALAVEAVMSSNIRELSPHLKYDYKEINLKLGVLPTKEELIKIEKEEPQYMKFWASHLLDQLNANWKLIDDYPYPVQVWRLGEQTIVGLAGEVVVDYAINLKRILGQETFVFGYCNEGNLSYIPSARIIEEGGYEGMTAQYYKGFPAAWAPDIEIDILKTVTEMESKLSP